MNLNEETLLKAYSMGTFPMSENHNDPNIYWINPKKRGVIPIDKFKISKSLKKEVKKNFFKITFNKSFGEVIKHCAKKTNERPSTWINKKIINVYSSLHRLGHAHSVEVWLKKKLVGGLYGVSLGSAFFGESMFSLVPNASKISLVYLITHLKIKKFTLLDTQFINPHLKTLGAIEITREKYLRLLSDALKKRSNFRKKVPKSLFYKSLQSIIQTS